MKKKVLFALIALFSFLSSWAATDVVVGDYTVQYVTPQYVALTGTDGVAAPALKIKKGTADVTPTSSYVLDEDGYKVEDNDHIYDPGKYTWVVNFKEGTTQMVLKAPFYVAEPFDGLEHVNDKTTFDNSLLNGFYNNYYQKYPWCDVWYQWGDTEADGVILYPGQEPEQTGGPGKTGDAFYPGQGGKTQQDAEDWFENLAGQDYADNIMRSWYATQQSNPDSYGFVYYEDAAGNIVVFTDGANVDFAEKMDGNNVVKVVLGNEGGFMMMAASNFAEWNMDKFKLLLVPSTVDLTPSVAEATVLTATEAGYECEPLPYIGVKHQPTFSFSEGEDVNASVFINPTGTAGKIELVEGVDYEVEYDDNGDYVNVGTHPFTINFIGEYAGSLEAEYDIVKAHVNLNLAYIYKTYGEADPVLPANATAAQIEAYTNKLAFEIDASTPLKGADVKSDIAKFLVFKRASGELNQGEEVKEYEYYYDKTADFEENCNYSVSFLQTKSLLIIQKAPLTVKVDNNWKEWNQKDPDPWNYTIVSGLVNNDTKDNVAIEITRAEGEDVNAHLEKIQNKDVAVLNAQAEAYAFAGTAKNYEITFENGFMIVPSSNTSGITVTFAQTSYPYNGTNQEPTPIVKDGETLLTAGTDYDIEGYNDNKDVTDNATCQITLKGNYIATGDASKKQGTFAITRVKLTAYAESYTAEPLNGYEVKYNGFVNGETVESETAKNTATVTYFKTPDAPIVTKGDAIEQDVYELVIKKQGWVAKNYEIETLDGILALNDKPIIYAYPDPQSQEYTGTVDKELTFATYESRFHTPDSKMTTNPVTDIIGQAAYVIAKEDPTNANVGRYDITLRGATVLKDYNVVYDNRTNGYTITRKGLKLKAINATKVYGSDDPIFDAVIVEGTKEWTREQMDAAGIINNGPNNTGYWVGCGQWNGYRWTHSENVGEYNITLGLRSTRYGNYEITSTEGGKFTITPYLVKITADDQTKQFGENDPGLTVTITDNNEGDTKGEEVSTSIIRELRGFYVINRPDAGTEAGEAVGEHAIIVKAPTQGQAPNITEIKPTNYTITFVNGKLNITKALMTVKANDQYVDYGNEPNPYDVQINTSTEVLKWQKSGKDGLTPDQEAINAKIKSLVELSVLPGKKMMGGNEDAYKLTVKESGSYALDESYNEGDFVNGFDNGWLTVYPLTTIPLGKEALAKITDVELQQVLEDHKGLEGITVVLPNRAMKKDQWYEWVLPFDVTPRDFFYPIIDEEEEIFQEPRWGYGAINILDKAKSQSGKVVFSFQVMNTIPANTPFIVKIDKDITAEEMEQISFKAVIDENLDYVNEDPTSESADKSVKFVGLYYDKTGIDANQLYLAKANGHADREFWPGGETAKNLTLVRTKAYLEFPTPEAAARATILIEDENGTYTAINGVEVEDAEAAEGWYTITGVKLEGEPATTGTYIFNGKKVFIQK